MMNDLKDYEVTVARFIGGQHRAVGDPVKMTERAAKYYMEPHGTGLKLPNLVVAPVDDKPTEKPAAKTEPAANANG
ncbi:hypothetical protein [Sulfitobacter sp.]|uniref:hypothetical protein n=1 Tax=Sulfitobacter sp. TaxID=1903071 RepID=UPI0030016DCE